MEEKENVYGENTGAEELTQVKHGGAEGKIASEKNASAVLGKFKDVNALARAYESLQSEFTRRSQRLKELEKQAENFAREKGGQSEDSGAEKLRKNAEARRAIAQEFDGFVADMNAEHERLKTAKPAEGEPSEIAASQTEAGKTEAVDLSETVASEGRKEESGTEEAKAAFVGSERGSAGENTSPSVAESVENGLSAEELYRQVSRDEGVRLRIIGEYLASVGRSAPPLTAKGVGTIATPPLKARSIGDAGTMALQYFKKP